MALLLKLNLLLLLLLLVNACIFPPPKPVFDARNLQRGKKEIKYIYSPNQLKVSYLNQDTVNEQSVYPIRHNGLFNIGIFDNWQLGGGLGIGQIIINTQYQMFSKTNISTYSAIYAQAGFGGMGFTPLRTPGESLGNFSIGMSITNDYVKIYDTVLAFSTGFGYEINHLMEDFISVGDYENYEVSTFPVVYEQSIDIDNLIIPFAIIISNGDFGLYASIEYTLWSDIEIYKEILVSKDASGYDTYGFNTSNVKQSDDLVFNFATYYRL